MLSTRTDRTKPAAVRALASLFPDTTPLTSPAGPVTLTACVMRTSAGRKVTVASRIGAWVSEATTRPGITPAPAAAVAGFDASRWSSAAPRLMTKRHVYRGGAALAIVFSPGAKRLPPQHI